MAIIGFENYKVVSLSHNVLKIPKSYSVGSFFDRNPDEHDHILRIPEKTPLIDSSSTYSTGKVLDILRLAPINKTPFDEKSSVYVHTNCEIPRDNVRRKYKRVLNPEKATICLIPNSKEEIQVTKKAIFINDKYNVAFCISSYRTYDYQAKAYVLCEPIECEGQPLGTKLKDINPGITSINIDARSLQYYTPNFLKDASDSFFTIIADSQLAAYGNFVELDSKQRYIEDILSGALHDIVTENVLTESLGTEDTEITADVINSIKAFIMSEDMSVVGLGLKTLSELNYAKYKNSIIYLLNSTYQYWIQAPLKNTTSIKYMLKYLGMEYGIRTVYESNITPEDFELLKHVVHGHIIDSINVLKRDVSKSFPFATISITAETSITRKE